MKQLKLSAIGQYCTYKNESLLPLLISSLGYNIVWVDPNKCDILIIGKPMSPMKWFLKKGTSVILPDQYHTFINKHIDSRHYKPLTLFHTSENLRHDSVKTDYSISFDFSEDQSRHFRFPYWMEMVDWSHEGLQGNTNKRFGKLLSITRMMQPLGKSFLSKPRKAVIFASHLDGQRKHFYNSIKNIITIDGFGKYFNRKINSNSSSGLEKFHILNGYAFNLCPENKLYPGYYTEKIPEAFLGDTLPVTWADSLVSADFNPKALINLAEIDCMDFEVLKELLHNDNALAAYAEQPLLVTKPSIEPFQEFVRKLILQAV